MERCDVAIIGGGVIGSAIAYFLAAERGFGGSVVVFERDPSYGRAASALSASGIRQQFSADINIRMSLFGIAFLREAGRLLAIDGDAPEIGLREAGYLFLASPEGAAVLASNQRRQRALGADVALLDPPALAARFPWLATEGIALGSLGLSGEGWFDGYALLQAFRRKAGQLGVAYRAAAVVGIERHGRRIAGLRLDDGGAIRCGAAVNAAGPQAGAVAALAGIALPVAPRKRCVFVFDCREPVGPCPLVIDPAGVYFRPEGSRFIAGTAPPPERDPADPDFAVDEALFEEIVWPALARRVPAFAAIKRVGAWAGHYDWNAADQNALLGLHPALDNLYFANGFSGHGLQHAPAAGRGIAELIAHGGYRSLDLSPLGVARLVEGRTLGETGIV